MLIEPRWYTERRFGESRELPPCFFQSLSILFRVHFYTLPWRLFYEKRARRFTRFWRHGLPLQSLDAQSGDDISSDQLESPEFGARQGSSSTDPVAHIPRREYHRRECLWKKQWTITDYRFHAENESKWKVTKRILFKAVRSAGDTVGGSLQIDLHSWFFRGNIHAADERQRRIFLAG